MIYMLPAGALAASRGCVGRGISMQLMALFRERPHFTR